MREVEGRVAVITGGASGIGRGMAESFAAAGMKLVLADVEEGALRATADALRSGGADVHPVVTDVAKADQVQALADATLQRFGAVHVVCNNAGIGITAASIWDTSLDDWTWILGVNLLGVVHGVRSFVPILIDQGEESHVVNTASLAGLIPGEGAYGVTKFGVVALSETLQFDLERVGARTRVSVLCPGFVDTNILDSERNRPAELGDASPAPPDELEALRETFAKLLAQGMSPRTVGDQVLAAIREQRFYVLTHPDWNPLIEERMRNILEGRNPTRSAPPGLEALMAQLMGTASREG